jgi:hypothetical protein
MGKEKRLNINMKIYTKIGILIIWTIFCYFIYAWITQSLGDMSPGGYLQFIIKVLKANILTMVLIIIGIVVITIKNEFIIIYNQKVYN